MPTAAERSAVDGSGINQSLIAIAQGALGNQEAARQALDRMAEVSSLLRHPPIDRIVDALVAGWRQAGWTGVAASPPS